MRVLIVGASGMIGRHFLRDLPMIDPRLEALGTYNRHALPGGFAMDITDPSSIAKGLDSASPDAIIWLAGSKEVAALERSPEQSAALNEFPIRHLIDLLGKRAQRPRLIYISSDYVFSGQHGHYREGDSCAPNTVYGRSKLRAEQWLLEAFPHCVTLRTSAVMSSHGGFLAWLNGELANGNEVTLFDNAAFSPTPPQCLSQAIVTVLRDDSLRGALNFAGPRTTRYDFGRQICETLGFSDDLVKAAQVDFTTSLLKPDLSLVTSDALKSHAPRSLSAFTLESCS